MTASKTYGLRPVTAMFDETVAQKPKAIATHFLGHERSYGDLGGRCQQVAAGLANLGVRPGDKVGLVMPNAPQFIIYYYATLKLGATVVNFNPLYTEQEMLALVHVAKPKVLVSFNLTDIITKLGRVADASDCVEALVMIPFTRTLSNTKAWLFRMLRGKDMVSTLECRKLIHHEDLIDTDTKPHYPDLDMNATAVLQFTGGTTGLPKAAMLTHRNIAANLEQARDWLPQLPDNTAHMAVLPFFHIFAMTCVMNFSVAQGFKMILMPRFEIKQFLALVHKHKPNILCAVPTLLQAVLNNPKSKSYNLSSLQYGISGGAPLPVQVKHAFEDLTGATVVEGYGLSETSPVVTSNPFFGENKAGSVGQTWPGVEVSIRDVDDPSRVLEQGQSGELCFKGPNVFAGYYENPGATEKAFVDGYFRTGDVGYQDEEGYIFINDRIKDMIIASGYKVFPRAVEDALYKHDAVAEALVLGVKDAYRGEAPVAYVSLREGHKVTKEALLEFLTEYLSKIEMPEDIIFRDSLPKTLIGKPSRKDLRIELENEAANSAA